MCKYCDALAYGPHVAERQQKEKEKRKRGECRHYDCTKPKHPNRATCDEHQCLAGCTKGYTVGNHAFCGRDSCKIPTCDYEDCKEKCFDERGHHTKCERHQEYKCSADGCDVATLEFTYCTTHKCEHKECDQLATYADHRCNIHTSLTCARPGCGKFRVEGSRYCEQDKCIKCRHEKHESYTGSVYCKKHKCSRYRECTGEAMVAGGVCSHHSCAVPDCRSETTGFKDEKGDSFCTDHKCSRCNARAVDHEHGSHLCEKHLVACEYCDVPASKGTKYCSQHQCHAKFCLDGCKCTQHTCVKCKVKKDDDTRFCYTCRCPGENCGGARSTRSSGLCNKCHKK